MKFEKIKFENDSTQRVYNNYINQIVTIVHTLPEEEQLDILMEINSYIYEGMQKSNGYNELEYLLNIIDNFGDLEKVLKPIIAERKLDQATKTFNPIHIFRALFLNIQNGFFFIFISICYMGLGFLGIAILAKLFFPAQIGMYYKPGEYFVLAGIPGEGVNEMEYELLGNWYIPVMTIGIVSFYFLITMILKFEKHLRTKGKLKTGYNKAYNVHAG